MKHKRALFKINSNDISQCMLSAEDPWVFISEGHAM